MFLMIFWVDNRGQLDGLWFVDLLLLVNENYLRNATRVISQAW